MAEEPTSKPAKPKAKAPAKPTAPPPVFSKWMALALLIGIGGGGPALFGYFDWSAKYNRPAPKVGVCYQGLSARLKQPVVTSPSEPQMLGDDSVVYLTVTQARAVQCAGDLRDEASDRLARALTVEDPHAQAKALADAVTAAPADKDYDKEALGLWMLSSPALESLPKDAERDAAAAQMDQFVGCRFAEHGKLPVCRTRNGFPIWIGALGFIGAFALALIPASLLQSAGRALSNRGKKKKDAAKPKPAKDAEPKLET